MEQEYHYLFKILLIGDSAVGKTSLLLRYVDDVYNPEFKTTIGVDFKISTMELDSKIVKLQLWDTAGQDKFRNIVASYYRGANGIIIVYDITNRESFDNVRRWYDETRSYLQEDIPKLLVGNKVDVASQRSVDLADAADLANSLGMQHVETSAKTNTNIKEAFTSMTRSILNKVSIIRSPQTAATGGTQLGGGQPIAKKGCCRGFLYRICHNFKMGLFWMGASMGFFIKLWTNYALHRPMLHKPWQYATSMLGFGIGAIYYDWYRRFCLEAALEQEELLDSKNEAIKNMRSAAFS